MYVFPFLLALGTTGQSMVAVVSTDAGARMVVEAAVALYLALWTRSVLALGESDVGRPVLLVASAASALALSPGIRVSVAVVAMLGLFGAALRLDASRAGHLEAEEPGAVGAANLWGSPFPLLEILRLAVLGVLLLLAFSQLGDWVAAMVGFGNHRSVTAVVAVFEVAFFEWPRGGCGSVGARSEGQTETR